MGSAKNQKDANQIFQFSARKYQIAFLCQILCCEHVPIKNSYSSIEP